MNEKYLPLFLIEGNELPTVLSVGEYERKINIGSLHRFEEKSDSNTSYLKCAADFEDIYVDDYTQNDSLSLLNEDKNNKTNNSSSSDSLNFQLILTPYPKLYYTIEEEKFIIEEEWELVDRIEEVISDAKMNNVDPLPIPCFKVDLKSDHSQINPWLINFNNIKNNDINKNMSIELRQDNNVFQNNFSQFIENYKKRSGNYDFTKSMMHIVKDFCNQLIIQSASAYEMNDLHEIHDESESTLSKDNNPNGGANIQNSNISHSDERNNDGSLINIRNIISDITSEISADIPSSQDVSLALNDTMLQFEQQIVYLKQISPNLVSDIYNALWNFQQYDIKSITEQLKNRTIAYSDLISEKTCSVIDKSIKVLGASVE